MANLLDVVIRTCFCESRFCTTTVTVDDVNSELFVGGIFSFSAITSGDIKPIFPFGCYEVMSLKDSGKLESNTVFINQYLNCEECLTDISNALVFRGCKIDETVYFTKTSFSATPTQNDVFFLEYYIDNLGGGYQRVQGCFSFEGLTILRPDQLTLTGLISATPYGNGDMGCQNCVESSPIVYAVQECLSGDEYYVGFPSNTFDNHLVTFTDLAGVTQYCGIVGKQKDNPLTGLLVNDLGLFNEEQNNCDLCLENVGEKKKLVNCLNPTDEIIVWASQLFQAGDVTNISVNNSCYTISPDPVNPSTPITYSEFVNFDPHSNCEDCFECHGITLDFSSCTEVTVCGQLPGGTSFSSSGGYSLIIDGSVAYVGFRNSGEVFKLNIPTSTILSNYGGPGVLPGKMSINPVSKILAIPDENGPGTKFVNTNTNVSTSFTTGTLSRRPVSTYFNPNDGYFYTGIWNQTGSSIVNIYSTSAFPVVSLVNTITLPCSGCYYIDVIQVGSKLFVFANSFVYVYNATTYNLLTSVGLSFNVTSVTYSPTTNKIFAVGQSNSITSVDPNTYATVTNGIFPACCSGGFVYYDTTSNKLFVTISSINNLFQVNENSLTILNTFNITTSSNPQGIGVYSGSPYVLNFNSLLRLGCANQFITKSIDSFEYIPIGNTFYHPYYDVCCTVTDIRTDMDGEFRFYSLKSFSSCTQCNNTNFEVFVGSSCDVGISGVAVALAGEYSINDIVRSHWGNSDFLCFTLEDYYTPGNALYDYNFETESQPAYSSCTDCTASATVGITIINCKTLVESYVNVSLEAWNNIFGTIGLATPCMSDSKGNCYTVVNTCPIDNVYDEFVPSNFYYDCNFCKTDNPGIQPRSANTESFVCVTCCPCDGSSGSTTNVVAPHPVWTDGYGVSVTQMNMITLGGINGLNG